MYTGNFVLPPDASGNVYNVLGWATFPWSLGAYGAAATPSSRANLVQDGVCIYFESMPGGVFMFAFPVCWPLPTFVKVPNEIRVRLGRRISASAAAAVAVVPCASLNKRAAQTAFSRI